MQDTGSDGGAMTERSIAVIKQTWIVSLMSYQGKGQR